MMSHKYIHAIYLFCLFVLLNGCRTAETFSQTDAFDLQSPTGYREHHEFAEFSGQPRQIALLLPLSGQHADSAKAIQEGFLASYYENHQGAKPTIRIYDTTREKDIHLVYNLAVQDGADFIVGPLSKEDVYRLSQLPHHRMKAPILALNRHPEIRTSPKQFVQFTLAPETEAEQIADKAWQKGYRSASIVVPDNTWGKRTANAFSTQWRNQGGKILHTVFVNPSQDQSAAVKRLLGVDESQQRANQIKHLITEKVDFQPRRRQDVDVIVMAAPPDQARQLKPLLDFYYADDVPVYATSSIYSGKPNPKQDRDINGVVFCDMPWLLDQRQGEHIQRLLNRNSPSQSDQYNRLFAMGVDAYHLSQRFASLQSGAQFPGATGILSLNNNSIERRLAFAKITSGVPTHFN